MPQHPRQSHSRGLSRRYGTFTDPSRRKELSCSVPCTVCDLCVYACRAEAAEGRPGHLRAGCSPRVDRQARHLNAPSRYNYRHIMQQSLQSGSRCDSPCVSMCAWVRMCARTCACACVRVGCCCLSCAYRSSISSRFALSESIRYKLSRIHLPDYKETCHTTNVSDSFFTLCGFAT